MEGICYNAVAPSILDGEPCVAIAGYGKGSGVYLLHAVTLTVVRSYPCTESVNCVCLNASGSKLFFGTDSGLDLLQF